MRFADVFSAETSFQSNLFKKGTRNEVGSQNEVLRRFHHTQKEFFFVSSIIRKETTSFFWIIKIRKETTSFPIGYCPICLSFSLSLKIRLYSILYFLFSQVSKSTGASNCLYFRCIVVHREECVFAVVAPTFFDDIMSQSELTTQYNGKTSKGYRNINSNSSDRLHVNKTAIERGNSIAQCFALISEMFSSQETKDI